MKLESRKKSISAKDLKPSQNDLYLDHIFSRLIVRDDERKSILKNSLMDLDIIISSDNYIIDGHHRWALTIVLNPECEIICTQLKSKFDDVLDDLNQLSNNEEEHKKGGEFKLKDWMDNRIVDFTKNKIMDIMLDAIKNGIEVGDEMIRSEKNWKKKKYFKKMRKKLDIENDIELINYFYNNLKKIPKSDKDINRRNMPQVKKEDIQNVNNGNKDTNRDT